MDHDLNDIYYFVKVVNHGGFAAASRELGVPKSTLSRRISALEDRQNVRLIHRTTRQFRPTEIGQIYYNRCQEVLTAANVAQSVIDSTHSGPCGTIRLSCPIALLHSHVAKLLVEFANEYPDVTIQLVDTNLATDLVADGLDIAIRARPSPLVDSDLKIRILGKASQHLVASPELVSSQSSALKPADLFNWPSLANSRILQKHSWFLYGQNGDVIRQPHVPRIITTDMQTLKMAALDGLGIVQLPNVITQNAIDTGKLAYVLEDWQPAEDIIHALFPTTRGLPPTVRILLDFLHKKLKEF